MSVSRAPIRPMRHALAVIVMVAGLVGCQGQPPEVLMTPDKQLTPCGTAPHCVSSQASPDDTGHYVAPLRFVGSATAARDALIAAINETPRSHIEQATNGFIHATFRSRLGFVDDVTAVIDESAARIEIKSASRLGYYDFGVNRRRVEALRVTFNEYVLSGDP